MFLLWEDTGLAECYPSAPRLTQAQSKEGFRGKGFREALEAKVGGLGFSSRLEAEVYRFHSGFRHLW